MSEQGSHRPSPGGHLANLLVRMFKSFLSNSVVLGPWVVTAGLGPPPSSAVLQHPSKPLGSGIMAGLDARLLQAACSLWQVCLQMTRMEKHCPVNGSVNITPGEVQVSIQHQSRSQAVCGGWALLAALSVGGWGHMRTRHFRAPLPSKYVSRRKELQSGCSGR